MKRVIVLGSSAAKDADYRVTFTNTLHGLGVKHCKSIEEVYDLLKPYVHPSQQFILTDMIERDKKCTNGRICSTGSYEVYKGEHQMTEYTSF